MRIAATAWRMRQAARQALEAGAPARALELAAEAQHVHRTPGGEALRLLIGWLSARADARSLSPPGGTSH